MTDHPRVQRSKRAFENAAIAAAESDMETLTVTALCEASGLNRGTFYLHYKDLDDLLASTVERLAQEAVERWKESLADPSAEGSAEASMTAFGEYLEHIHARRAFYRWALVARGSYRAVSATAAVYVGGIGVGLRGSRVPWSKTELSRRSAYLAGAMTGVIIDWVSDDEPETAVELRDWLWNELLSESTRLPESGHGR